MAQLAVLAVMAVSSLHEASVKKKQAVRSEKFIREESARNSAAMTAEMQDLIDQKIAMESRALTVAAASGAGIDDPTVVNLIGDLNAEGEYRVMSRLWVGDAEAEGMSFQANEAYRAGEDAKNAGYINAAKSVMSAWSGYSSPKATTSSALPSTVPTPKVSTKAATGNYVH